MKSLGGTVFENGNCKKDLIFVPISFLDSSSIDNSHEEAFFDNTITTIGTFVDTYRYICRYIWVHKLIDGWTNIGKEKIERERFAF